MRRPASDKTHPPPPGGGSEGVKLWQRTKTTGRRTSLSRTRSIVESELVKEMKDSYIDYAVSVIVGRALPDVRDGLKPGPPADSILHV